MPAGDDVDLPRMQAGANPQHLLVTLFGDYWLGRREHLPSVALVALTAEFGITSTSARAALSRLARRGLLESSKVGRRTRYGLTPRADRVLAEGADRIVAFGTDDRPWDGSWTVVIFSVPEDQRDVRHVVRTRLRWAGYGPLYDGVWVSPRADAGETAKVLDELRVTSTVLVSRLAHEVHGGDPLGAWDLADLRARYERFIAEFTPLLERVRRRKVGGDEALVVRTTLMDLWRQFPNLDPELPDDVLPGGWPRRDARQLFVDLYDGLGPIAEARFREIVGRFDPALAGRARHGTTEDMRRG